MDQGWLALVDGKVVPPKTRLLGGEKLDVTIVQSNEEMAYQAEAMDLPIIYEDEHILVVNKPAGLVHPASGNWTGTLLNGLLHHCPPATCRAPALCTGWTRTPVA
jgi:23S rRNA pseudouridine1911/1915/1917 synthase